MPRKTLFQVYLDEYQREWVRQKALQTGWSQSAVLRKALEEYRTKEKKEKKGQIQ